tara:strand:+ start:16099 stop:18213 length:2115 start_codon:yes stop_codon:yes gene_type:complete
MNLKEWAVAYCELGFQVIPIGEDKKPLVKWKEYQLTEQEPELVEELWDRFPTAGIAVITGELSGIVVVDCDDEQSIREFEKLGCTTPVMQTTKRGRHYFFKHPKRVIKNATTWRGIKNIDVRGDGGLVKVYPSNGYKWELPLDVKVSDIPFELPDWEFEDYVPEVTVDGVVRDILPDDFSAGNRNDMMTRLVGKLIVDNPAAWGKELFLLALTENEKRCKPPLDQDEVKIIVVSVMQMHKKNNPDEFNADGVRKESLITDKERTLRAHMRLMFECDSIGLCGAPPERDWLVKDLIPAGLPGVIASSGGVGKTYLLMDLAMKIACPEEGQTPMFMGHPVRKNGKVVMFLAEDDRNELMRRFEFLDPAYRRIGFPDQLIVIPIPELETAMNFGTKKFDAPKFTQEADDWRNTLIQMEDLAMVVFDPLQSFFEWRFDEDNVAADRALKWAQNIAVKTGATVIFTHHLRKDDMGVAPTTPQGAIGKIRGASNIVNSSRFAIPIWRPSQEVCEEVSSRLNLVGNNNVFMAGLGKENFGGDVSTHWMIREPLSGLLVDRTDEIDGSRVEPADVSTEGMVIEAIRKGLNTRKDILSHVFTSKTVTYAKIKELIDTGVIVDEGKTLSMADEHPDFNDLYDEIYYMVKSAGRELVGVFNCGYSLRDLAQDYKSKAGKVLFKGAVTKLLNEGRLAVKSVSEGTRGKPTNYLILG